MFAAGGGTMDWGLQGKVAFVTGGGSGLARAVAMALGEAGIAVGVADKRLPSAESVAAEIESNGGKALAVEVNVTNSDQVNDAVARVEAGLGPIDYLANVAGFAKFVPFLEITDEAWHDLIHVHLNGAFFSSRAVLPGMISRGFGGIVTVSSLHAQIGQPRAVHYSAAKAGLMGFTRGLAKEVAGNGIRVNAVAPGPIDTPGWRSGMVTGGNMEEIMEGRSQVIPMGRMGAPEEIADVFMYLFSPSSSYVTGQIISINGGEVMY